MHEYLRSIGFSEMGKADDMKDTVTEVIKYNDEIVTAKISKDKMFAEFIRYYGIGMGIKVCGYYDADSKFHTEYVFPFFDGKVKAKARQLIVEKSADRESYIASIEETGIGVDLIFYLQNPGEYIRENTRRISNPETVSLAALSNDGKILLPVYKEKEAVKVEKEKTKNRNSLIEAAKKGDEDAMDSLTLEDMDTYSMISERIGHDDIYTIVDSYFMPQGLASDRYKVMGEIVDYTVSTNTKTGEDVFILEIESNDVRYDVCISRKDLLGEPKIGRRFKGNIWLQGKINY